MSDDDGTGGVPFGAWLRTVVAWLALVAGVALVAWSVVRPCPEEGCPDREDLFILLPAMPLVLIGAVTLLGEWALRRRTDRDDGGLD